MVKNLKYLREKNGISQEKLGILLETTQQAIDKYENQGTEPDYSTLIRIAKIFETSVDFLIGNTDIERKYDSYSETELNPEELLVVREYRTADEYARGTIQRVMNDLNRDKNR